MDALKRAVEIAGNPNALAALIGRRQSTVWYWLNTPGSKVSPDGAVEIERALNGQVTAAELRPDLAAMFNRPPVTVTNEPISPPRNGAKRVARKTTGRARAA